VDELWLIGRGQEKLDELRAQLKGPGRAGLKIAPDMAALSHCQLILTVTNAILSIIRPEHLQPAV